jgi:hypothetical protein
MEVINIDPRSSQQALSPRQKAFLTWLKGNMFPSYYRVLDTHMNVAKIDPEQHMKFLRKLEKGWRGWEQIGREGVDFLYSCTDAIPDSWSKKFQPTVDMLYAEQPFYTYNKVVEKFVYLTMLKESTEEEIRFSDFSSRIQESPYAGACDVYHFWEKLGDPDFKKELMEEDPVKIQGLVFLISAFYMLTTVVESIIFSIPFVGILYKLFLWSFVGLNKVYGVLNTMYWHSTGKSSREISRIQPRDPYLVSKQFVVFLVDLIPSIWGYTMTVPIAIFSLLPPLLESIGKTWYVGSKLKEPTAPNKPVENPWSSYADEYIDKLRESPTKKAYVAARTATGKSTMFIAALFGAKHRKRVRKIWLVEPRKVLRDETVIPFGVPTQRLKRGIKPSKEAEVYILTYGHFQSRLLDVDVEQDIVLFDEFHEQQGEMILGLDKCKAPTFLLSATPADIPALKGSPFLTPNIDRRHPTTIHKMPDGMSTVDMFMEAQNRYPELSKRALIIVPTHKEVVKTIAALTYLKVGEVNPLTARDRVVPESGVIVSTPYVQTGLDIKPPVKLLVDCGKDIVFDKGRFVTPLPWTDPDVNQQRVGRVSRLEAGVVFQPESAGTGKKGVYYPSPNLFQHESVAKHFRMPQLTPVSGAVGADLPFLRLNTRKLQRMSEQRSVALIHAFALAGVRQEQWKGFYCKKQENRSLGEDYEYIDRIYNHPKWITAPLLDWDTVMYFVHDRDSVEYSINGIVKNSLPLIAINGTWQEVEVSPSSRLNIEPLSEEQANSRYVTLKTHFDNWRSAFAQLAQQIGDEKLQETLTVLAH